MQINVKYEQTRTIAVLQRWSSHTTLCGTLVALVLLLPVAEAGIVPAAGTALGGAGEALPGNGCGRRNSMLVDSGPDSMQRAVRDALSAH
ncbi:MAG TPA: hypothetical protein VJY39_04765 [Acidisphaera sp.]|nr:hypothetical protein [Acidisphaera sp.]